MTQNGNNQRYDGNARRVDDVVGGKNGGAVGVGRFFLNQVA